jgi:hypothetical protein
MTDLPCAHAEDETFAYLVQIVACLSQHHLLDLAHFAALFATTVGRVVQIERKKLSRGFG